MALIPDDPKQRNALLLGVLTIALFYVFWSYWYSPKQEEIAANNERLEALVQSNRLAEIRVARGGDELEARLAQYEGHVDRLEGLIPQSEEVASLLNQISSAARETGVSDPNMSPEPQEVGAFYTKDSYQIEVIGEYHDIGRFLTEIASLPRIITPVDLELSPFQGDPSILDPDLENPLSARLRIQTYILPANSNPLPVEGSGGEGGG
jgi:type IV pilus assembly protein PilO